ncbi:MAG: hypothetical protein ACRDSP_00020 [Pseudonocardiaceae bacterium]
MTRERHFNIERDYINGGYTTYDEKSNPIGNASTRDAAIDNARNSHPPAGEHHTYDVDHG